MQTVTVDLSDARFEQWVPFDTLAHLRANHPVWWWRYCSPWIRRR